ncbi:MAG: TatD family deoxyribonuclease [Candidatus Bathyarchaeum sp.]|nr:MAG: TatD family deoxyribonuclease [Candidatus Bathyarchaeum sp.]
MLLRFVDAHIHLSDSDYAQNLGEIVEEAKQLGVFALVANAMDLESSRRSLKLAEEYPDHVYAALGIHPWNTKKLAPNETQDTIDLIFENAENKQRLVAVGEIGLDATYAGNGEPTEIQMQVFHEMLSAAEKSSLPVIIHSRGTTSQIVSLLPSYKIKKVLLHWFSQPHSLISKIVDRGYYITEGPPSIFSGSIREVIRRIPLTNLMTETDGPVRFRGPFKGKLTTPSFIPTVVEAIAELKEKEKSEVADQIFQNFIDFFGVECVRDKRHDEGTIHG